MIDWTERLANTEWLLEDLAGAGVMDTVQTTLRFDDTLTLGGSGGCNRYRAGVEITQDGVQVGAIASTRMLCPPAVMNQESRYFQALQSAQRIVLADNDVLYIYPQGSSAPLRFTRLSVPSEG